MSAKVDHDLFGMRVLTHLIPWHGGRSDSTLFGNFPKKSRNVVNRVSRSNVNLDIGIAYSGQEIIFLNWSVSPSFSGESAP
jgi:hypothetical protein